MAPQMTFYGARGAPNPRRVEIFMAEHGLAETAGYKYVDISMAKGEHKRGGKYETPNKKVPMMTVGGETIGESVAICRYVEETRPAGSDLRLFGNGALQRARVEMWTRRIELELFHGSIGKAWIHGPFLAPMRKRTGLVGHPSELELGLRLAQHFYKELDHELSARAFVAGGAFSVADITLLCVLDFGAGPVRVPMRWSELPHLAAWHERVSARASVQLHRDPYAPRKGQRYADRNVAAAESSSSRL